MVDASTEPGAKYPYPCNNVVCKMSLSLPADGRTAGGIAKMGSKFTGFDDDHSSICGLPLRRLGVRVDAISAAPLVREPPSPP